LQCSDRWIVERGAFCFYLFKSHFLL